MLLCKRWAWLGPTLATFTFITACTTLQPDVVSPAPEKQVVAIPELDTKARIPLKVAVYLAPRVLGRSAILDLRQSSAATKNIISNGPTGAATIAAIAQYFPDMFDEVYLIASFPDARLSKRKLDLVIVVQDSATRHLLDTGLANDTWETQLKLALCRPDGSQITRYTVTTTSKPATASKPTDPEGIINWVYRASQDAIKPAVRLALQRFPKTDVLSAVQKKAVKASRVQAADDWETTRKEFEQDLEKEKIFIPLPDMTLEQYLNRPSAVAVESMVMANAMVLGNTQLLAQYYARSPAVFNQTILNSAALNPGITQVYEQQLQTLATGKDPQQQPLVFEFIGGHHKKIRTATHVKPKTHKPVSVTTAQDTPVQLVQSKANPEIAESLTLLDGLRHVGKSPSADSTVANKVTACMDELRRIKQALLDKAKESGSSVQLLRSATSGAIVYSNKTCSIPVPTNLDKEQSSNEAQRIALCGVQSVNCALAKVYSGMDCQLAVNRCMQESPLPK